MQRPVLIFLDSRDMGGIESHVFNLANAHAAAGRAVRVVFWRNYKCHPLVPMLAEHRIAFDYANGSLLKLARIISQWPQSVLHCHGYKASLLGRLLAMALPVKCVTTFHNGDRGEGKLRFYTWLDEKTSFLSSNIAVSKEIASRLSAKCEVIPNFVDIPPEMAAGQRREGVGFVGRLEPVKRPDRFISLSQALPGMRFSVFGDGSLAQNLKEKASANTVFMGQVTQMQKHWRSMDALVVCSDAEGLPMVVLEAMSYGVCVFALPLGDIPTVIDHGVDGFIAQDMTSMESLLRDWSMMSFSQRLSIRAAARRKIRQHFSSQSGLERIQKLYV